MGTSTPPASRTWLDALATDEVALGDATAGHLRLLDADGDGDDDIVASNWGAFSGCDSGSAAQPPGVLSIIENPR